MGGRKERSSEEQQWPENGLNKEGSSFFTTNVSDFESGKNKVQTYVKHDEGFEIGKKEMWEKGVKGKRIVQG